MPINNFNTDQIPYLKKKEKKKEENVLLNFLPINFRTKFGYKLVCSQLNTTHYVTTNKIIHVDFSHMTYLMSYVTTLNNTCEWFYKLPRNGL